MPRRRLLVPMMLQSPHLGIGDTMDELTPVGRYVPGRQPAGAVYLRRGLCGPFYRIVALKSECGARA